MRIIIVQILLQLSELRDQIRIYQLLLVHEELVMSAVNIQLCCLCSDKLSVAAGVCRSSSFEQQQPLTVLLLLHVNVRNGTK